MGRVVFIGHGGFNTKSEMILVPKNTTITFLADAGSPLALPHVSTLPAGETPADGVWKEGVNCTFDYEKVANLLDNYLQAETQAKPRDQVYNMFVEPVGEASLRVAKELAKQGKWGGELRTTPSSLCTGNAQKCPTPMLLVAERNHTRFNELDQDKRDKFTEWVDGGAKGNPPEGLENFAAPGLTDQPDKYYFDVIWGVSEDEWEHDCDGLLGKDVAGGNDIIWLSCSGFAVNQEALNAIGLPEGLPPEMTRATYGPGLDWVPSKDDFERIAKLNAQRIKDTPTNKAIRVRVGDPLVAVGDDHEGNVENYLKRKQDVSEGTITVNKKAGAFRGELTVEGIPEDHWTTVENALASLNSDVNFASG
jgi:hypothetical protein